MHTQRQAQLARPQSSRASLRRAIFPCPQHSTRLRQDHNPGQLYLLYTDTNGIRVFLRRLTVIRGEVDAADPILVSEGPESFTRQFPSMAIGPEGRPWVVIRSYEGATTPTAAIVDIWLTRALGPSLEIWSEPVRVSSSEDAVRGGAGTSGSLAFSGEGFVVVFGITGELVAYTASYRSIGELTRQSAGTFRGVHDFVLVADGGLVHLAYHADGVEVPTRAPALRDDVHRGKEVMTYRNWDVEVGWSDPIPLGLTGTHMTAMSVDDDGNVWVFYGNLLGEIRLRVLRSGANDFDPEICIGTVPEHVAASSAWLASSQPSGNSVGLLWVERPGEQWEVRFRTFTLDSLTTIAPCPN